MNTIRIYYNPDCSKCRATLAIITDRGYRPEIIEYLKTPPSRKTLIELLEKLGMRPDEIVRRGEAVFKEQYAHRTLDTEEWLDALITHPALIERPIVVLGNRAVVARPPEKVLAIL